MKNHILHSSLLLALTSLATQSESYSIDWSKIAGGGGTSTDGVYTVSGTIGQPDASGALAGGSFSVTGGFWSLISIVQAAGMPTLAITHTGDTVIISWPTPAETYTLQQTANLSAGNWVASGFTVTDANGTSSITINAATGNLFFRLSKP
jgi:hypothetical protein